MINIGLKNQESSILRAISVFLFCVIKNSLLDRQEIFFSLRFSKEILSLYPITGMRETSHTNWHITI